MSRTAANDFFPERIDSVECISGSIEKINRNFQRLENIVYALEDRLTINQVRTFYYYGPNARENATSGMRDNEANIPSNVTIEGYVNSNTQLNLPVISKRNDVAYVLYQKTGFYSTVLNAAQDTTINNFRESSSDVVNYFLPTLIMWRLTFNGTTYSVNTGFPKFTTALASVNPATPGNPQNWNNPTRWATF
jgi:hypothetical protein